MHWTQKGTDVSAMSFHKVMQTLYKADAMNEWGSIVALNLYGCATCVSRL